jgi:hypothetical protein
MAFENEPSASRDTIPYPMRATEEVKLLVDCVNRSRWANGPTPNVFLRAMQGKLELPEFKSTLAKTRRFLKRGSFDIVRGTQSAISKLSDFVALTRGFRSLPFTKQFDVSPPRIAALDDRKQSQALWAFAGNVMAMAHESRGAEGSTVGQKLVEGVIQGIGHFWKATGIIVWNGPRPTELCFNEGHEGRKF